jgi:hypothetical protein
MVTKAIDDIKRIIKKPYTNFVVAFSIIAIVESNANTMLNTRCSVHDIFSKIPPHEQGVNELKFRIITIYAENIIISTKLPYKPINRDLENINCITKIISTIGTATDTVPANALKRGD